MVHTTSKIVDVRKTRGSAARSKCTNSVLKVRYKHSQPREVWIFKVTQGVQHISRISHGYYGRVEKQLELTYASLDFAVH